MPTNLAHTSEALVQLRLVHLVADCDDQAAIEDLTATQILCISQIVYGERFSWPLRRAEADTSLIGATEHALRPVVRLVAAGTESYAL